MTIGELAKAAQCTVETIRYYEKEGLLPAPARTVSNYRRYGAAHLERLRFVRHCRALDMAHSEIRALQAMQDRPGMDCGAVNGLLDDHIEHVRLRIQELTQLQAHLRTLRDRCRSERKVEACGILQGLAEMT
jgi:Cd(II)/Pb(II)-responsive transcriptional regulator